MRFQNDPGSGIQYDGRVGDKAVAPVEEEDFFVQKAAVLAVWQVMIKKRPSSVSDTRDLLSKNVPWHDCHRRAMDRTPSRWRMSAS